MKYSPTACWMSSPIWKPMSIYVTYKSFLLQGYKQFLHLFLRNCYGRVGYSKIFHKKAGEIRFFVVREFSCNAKHFACWFSSYASFSCVNVVSHQVERPRMSYMSSCFSYVMQQEEKRQYQRNYGIFSTPMLMRTSIELQTGLEIVEKLRPNCATNINSIHIFWNEIYTQMTFTLTLTL